MISSLEGISHPGQNLYQAHLLQAVPSLFVYFNSNGYLNSSGFFF